MDQRISVVTLAVADLDRSRRFYEALGWDTAEVGDAVVAFDLIGQSLSLYGRDDLARDMGVDPAELGTGATTLACNVRAAADVQPVLAAFATAGGRVVADADELDWGGTVGYAVDPDGHVWEVAHNPFAPLAADGRFRWSGFDEQAGPDDVRGVDDRG